MRENLGILETAEERFFWPVIVFMCILVTSFLTSARRGRPRIVVKTKIGQDQLINNLLLHSGTVRTRYSVRSRDSTADPHATKSPVLYFWLRQN